MFWRLKIEHPITSSPATKLEIGSGKHNKDEGIVGENTYGDIQLFNVDEDPEAAQVKRVTMVGKRRPFSALHPITLCLFVVVAYNAMVTSAPAPIFADAAVFNDVKTSHTQAKVEYSQYEERDLQYTAGYDEEKQIPGMIDMDDPFTDWGDHIYDMIDPIYHVPHEYKDKPDKYATGLIQQFSRGLLLPHGFKDKPEHFATTLIQQFAKGLILPDSYKHKPEHYVTLLIQQLVRGLISYKPQNYCTGLVVPDQYEENPQQYYTGLVEHELHRPSGLIVPNACRDKPEEYYAGLMNHFSRGLVVPHEFRHKPQKYATGLIEQFAKGLILPDEFKHIKPEYYVTGLIQQFARGLIVPPHFEGKHYEFFTGLLLPEKYKDKPEHYYTGLVVDDLDIKVDISRGLIVTDGINNLGGCPSIYHESIIKGYDYLTNVQCEYASLVEMVLEQNMELRSLSNQIKIQNQEVQSSRTRIEELEIQNAELQMALNAKAAEAKRHESHSKALEESTASMKTELTLMERSFAIAEERNRASLAIAEQRNQAHENDKREMARKISSMTNVIMSNEITISSYTSRVKDLDHEIIVLKKDLVAAQAGLEKCRYQSRFYHQNFQCQNEDVKILATNIVSLEQMIVHLQQQLHHSTEVKSNLENRIAHLLVIINGHNEDQARYKKTIEELELEIARISVFEATVIDMQNLIAECEREKTRLNLSISSYEQQITSLNTVIVNHELSIDSYRLEINNCQDSVTDLHIKIDEQSQSLIIYQQKLLSSEELVLVWQQKYWNYEANCKKSQKSIIDLKLQIESLNKEILEHKNTIVVIEGNLDGERSECKSKISSLEITIQKLEVLVQVISETTIYSDDHIDQFNKLVLARFQYLNMEMKLLILKHYLSETMKVDVTEAQLEVIIQQIINFDGDSGCGTSASVEVETLKKEIAFLLTVIEKRENQVYMMDRTIIYLVNYLKTIEEHHNQIIIHDKSEFSLNILKMYLERLRVMISEQECDGKAEHDLDSLIIQMLVWHDNAGSNFQQIINVFKEFYATYEKHKAIDIDIDVTDIDIDVISYMSRDQCIEMYDLDCSGGANWHLHHIIYSLRNEINILLQQIEILEERNSLIIVKPAKSMKSEKSGKSDKAAKSMKSEKSGKSDKAAKSMKSEKSGKFDKAAKSMKSEKSGKFDKAAKSMKSEKSGKSDKAAKSMKSEKSGKSDKAAKSMKSEKSGKKGTDAPTAAPTIINKESDLSLTILKQYIESMQLIISSEECDASSSQDLLSLISQMLLWHSNVELNFQQILDAFREIHRRKTTDIDVDIDICINCDANLIDISVEQCKNKFGDQILDAKILYLQNIIKRMQSIIIDSGTGIGIDFDIDIDIDVDINSVCKESYNLGGNIEYYRGVIAQFQSENNQCFSDLSLRDKTIKDQEIILHRKETIIQDFHRRDKEFTEVKNVFYFELDRIQTDLLKCYSASSQESEITVNINSESSIASNSVVSMLQERRSSLSILQKYVESMQLETNGSSMSSSDEVTSLLEQILLWLDAEKEDENNEIIGKAWDCALCNNTVAAHDIQMQRLEARVTKLERELDSSRQSQMQLKIEREGLSSMLESLSRALEKAGMSHADVVSISDRLSEEKASTQGLAQMKKPRFGNFVKNIFSHQTLNLESLLHDMDLIVHDGRLSEYQTMTEKLRNQLVRCESGIYLTNEQIDEPIKPTYEPIYYQKTG